MYEKEAGRQGNRVDASSALKCHYLNVYGEAASERERNGEETEGNSHLLHRVDARRIHFVHVRTKLLSDYFSQLNRFLALRIGNCSEHATFAPELQSSMRTTAHRQRATI